MNLDNLVNSDLVNSTLILIHFTVILIHFTFILIHLSIFWILSIPNLIHFTLFLIHFTLIWCILTLILIHFTFLFWTLFWHKTWCLTGCRCFALSLDFTLTFQNLSFFQFKEGGTSTKICQLSFMKPIRKIYMNQYVKIDRTYFYVQRKNAAIIFRRPEKASRASRGIKSINCSKGGGAYFQVELTLPWCFIVKTKKHQLV